MNNKMKRIIWSTVIIINFILVNVGMDGWITGFAHGSFSSIVKKLLMVNYYESLIVPILLFVATYIILELCVNPRDIVDEVKKSTIKSVLIVALASQLLFIFITFVQLNSLANNSELLQRSILGNNYKVKLKFPGYSVDDHFSDIKNELENVKSKIDDLESEY